MTVELLTCIFSLAAMIAAVASPIIVAWINNRYQAKKENRDFYEKHRCEIIESYLRGIAQHLYSDARQFRAEYGIASAEIYMYVPASMWSMIDDMSECLISLEKMNPRNDPERELRNRAVQNAKEQYRDLCKAFSDFSRSPKSKKKYRYAKKK